MPLTTQNKFADSRIAIVMNEMDRNAIAIWCNGDAVQRGRVKVAFNNEILMVVAERILLEKKKSRVC